MISISDKKITITIEAGNADEYLENLRDAMFHALKFMSENGGETNPDPDGLNSYILDFLNERVEGDSQKHLNSEEEEDVNFLKGMMEKACPENTIKKPIENGDLSDLDNDTDNGNSRKITVEFQDAPSPFIQKFDAHLISKVMLYDQSQILLFKTIPNTLEEIPFDDGKKVLEKDVEDLLDNVLKAQTDRINDMTDKQRLKWLNDTFKLKPNK